MAELQEDISLKRFDLGVAQLRLAAVQAQVCVFFIFHYSQHRCIRISVTLFASNTHIPNILFSSVRIFYRPVRFKMQFIFVYFVYLSHRMNPEKQEIVSIMSFICFFEIE